MRSFRVRWLLGLLTVTACGMLYQTACIGYGTDQVLRSIDFCFLFDCQNGALGGLVQWCPNNAQANQLVVSTQNANTFIDCPVAEQN